MTCSAVLQSPARCSATGSRGWCGKTCCARFPTRTPASAAFGVPVDHVSEPIVGEHTVFVVEPVARHNADSTAFAKQLPVLRGQALQNARQSRVQLVLSSLRDQAKVDDRRKALEEAQKSAQEMQEVQQLRSGTRGKQSQP